MGLPGFLTHMSSVIATFSTLVPLTDTYSALEPVFKLEGHLTIRVPLAFRGHGSSQEGKFL